METRQKALGSPSKDAGNDVRRRTTRTDGWTNGRRRRTASDGFTGVPLPSPAENRNPKPELTLGQVRCGLGNGADPELLPADICSEERPWLLYEKTN